MILIFPLPHILYPLPLYLILRSTIILTTVVHHKYNYHHNSNTIIAINFIFNFIYYYDYFILHTIVKFIYDFFLLNQFLFFDLYRSYCKMIFLFANKYFIFNFFNLLNYFDFY